MGRFRKKKAEEPEDKKKEKKSRFGKLTKMGKGIGKGIGKKLKETVFMEQWETGEEITKEEEEELKENMIKEYIATQKAGSVPPYEPPPEATIESPEGLWKGQFKHCILVSDKLIEHDRKGPSAQVVERGGLGFYESGITKANQIKVFITKKQIPVTRITIRYQDRDDNLKVFKPEVPSVEWAEKKTLEVKKWIQEFAEKVEKSKKVVAYGGKDIVFTGEEKYSPGLIGLVGTEILNERQELKLEHPCIYERKGLLMKKLEMEEALRKRGFVEVEKTAFDREAFDRELKENAIWIEFHDITARYEAKVECKFEMDYGIPGPTGQGTSLWRYAGSTGPDGLLGSLEFGKEEWKLKTEGNLDFSGKGVEGGMSSSIKLITTGEYEYQKGSGSLPIDVEGKITQRGSDLTNILSGTLKFKWPKGAKTHHRGMRTMREELVFTIYKVPEQPTTIEEEVEEKADKDPI